MRSRLVLVATATLVVGTVTAAPAYADIAAPTVDNVVSTTPGLLTADAHTDQLYVAATITEDFADAVVFPVTDGTASISFETWGFGSGATLAVSACSTETFAAETCSVATSTSFEPTQATPVITWPEDTTLGPDDTFDVVSTDAGGGGTLVALIDNGVAGTAIPIDRNGTTDLATHLDGVGTVSLTRCSADHPSICNDTFDGGPISSPFTRYTATPFTVDPVATITQSPGTAQPILQTPLSGTYVADYHLEPAGSDDVTPGAEGLTGPVPEDGAISAFEIGDGLADGEWDLVVSLSVTDPEFGTDALPATTVTVPFSVDTSGPAVTLTPSRTTIHPRISGIAAFPNSVTVTATGDTGAITGWAVRKVGEEAAVRTFPAGISVTWNGKKQDGTVADKGSYEFVSTDSLGNLSAASTPVQVTSKHVVSGSFVREVKAAPTVVDKYVGRCSQLRRPALRGWVGSLGFYANTRCPNTAVRASLVSTVHGITVPAAYTYTYVRVSAYGGAARSLPRSRAVLRYLTDTGKWRYEYLMRPALGWQHPAVPASANAYVDSNNRLYWGVYTLSGHRYEVARFKVKLNYRRIVD